MLEIVILISSFLIADAIMFVNGYRGYFFHAKTEQEKAVRKKWFEDRGIQWNEDKEEIKKNKWKWFKK